MRMMGAGNEYADQRFAMIKQLQDESIDIGGLNNLKRILLDSKNVENGNLLPLEEYIAVKNMIFKDKPLKADALLLQQIMSSDDRLIDLGKLVEVIDCCNFLPVKVKKIPNKSGDIYCVLSSNMRHNFSDEEHESINDLQLKNSLELIWSILS